MYEKQIKVKYEDKVNPYTMKVDKQFIFLISNYGKFKFISFKNLKDMSFDDVLNYMIDVYDYVNFLKYIGKYKKAKVVEKIEARVVAIAKEKREIKESIV